LNKFDLELIEHTNALQLFDAQAWYVIARDDMDLYSKLLDKETNPFSTHLCDSFVKISPDVNVATKLSSCIQAIMHASDPTLLVRILETIISHPMTVPEIKENSNLANLLILTSMRIGKPNEDIIKYVLFLKNISESDVANVAKALSKFEVAVSLFKRIGNHEEAVRILLEELNDVNEARKYVEETKDPKAIEKLKEFEQRSK